MMNGNTNGNGNKHGNCPDCKTPLTVNGIAMTASGELYVSIWCLTCEEERFAEEVTVIVIKADDREVWQ
jgi:RNase P subunit RPR2